MVLGGPNGALGAFWPIFGLEKAFFEQFRIKIKFSQLFKICFSLAIPQKTLEVDIGGTGVMSRRYPDTG